MDNAELVEILSDAALEAKDAHAFNSNREKTIRASSAGKPLFELIFNDLVSPIISKHSDTTETNIERRLQHNMRISTGYVFEKAVAKLLNDVYPGYEIHTNLPLAIGSIKGHCDILLVNHDKKHAIVIECKALSTYGYKDTVEQRLMVDNWGYYSQLGIYMAAVFKELQRTAGEFYAVDGFWYAWAKKTEKLLVVPYEGGLESAVLAAEEAEAKAVDYFTVQHLISQDRLEDAVKFLLDTTVDLPEKSVGKTGVRYSTCGFHYHKLATLFINDDGKLNPTTAEAFLSFCFKALVSSEEEQKKIVNDLLTTAAQFK